MIPMNDCQNPPMDLFQWMVSSAPVAEDPPQPQLIDWHQRFLPELVRWASPLERAVAGGFLADRLAWVLAAGYGQALQAMVADLPAAVPAAFCVTESGGNHPRAIETRLVSRAEGWVLNGAKSFVTGADSARILMVAATTGITETGRPGLKMVRLPANIQGVCVTPLPAMAFVPEIPHGRVALDDVRVEPDWILPGDGYTDYIKPFRTLEDIHLMGAVMGYMTRISCSGSWPVFQRSKLFALLTSLVSLSHLPPLSPHGHVILGGIWSQMIDWLEKTAPFWNQAPPEVKKRWERDKVLFQVAQTARVQRLESAWERIAKAGTVDPSPAGR